jgi:WD40 repeat protein
MPSLTGLNRRGRPEVAIATDGTWLATSGWSGQDGADLGRRWHPRATLTGHKGAVPGVAIAPAGTWLATISGKTVRIWAADEVSLPH